MNWQVLVEALERDVRPGSITTYAEVSLWAYGATNRNQPVRSLLVGARNHGHQELTNRVVRADGRLANLPDGSNQQRKQLLSEGITFSTNGSVDLTVVNPVQLGVYYSDFAVDDFAMKHRPRRPHETLEEYYQRVSLVLPNFPQQIVSQWLYDHFDSVIQRYWWLGLQTLSFSLQTWTTEEIVGRITAWNEGAVKNWKQALIEDSSFQNSRLGKCMIAEGTWPVPPIVFNNVGGHKMPDGSPVGEFELIEGHHRLAYLRALTTSEEWKVKPEHTIWIVLAEPDTMASRGLRGGTKRKKGEAGW